MEEPKAGPAPDRDAAQPVNGESAATAPAGIAAPMPHARSAHEGEGTGRRKRRFGTAVVAAGLALVLGFGGGAAAGFQLGQNGATALSAQSQQAEAPQSGGGSPFSGSMPAPGSGGIGGSGEQSSGATQTDVEAATEDESTGVVIIETALGYQGSEAAGTGIVLSSDGLILTNNHVIESSTSISVTVATTGETYEATIVGTDSSNDIAVLQLQDASGLQVAALDEDDDLAVGDAVTAVGNAEGTGELSAADGEVTDLDATVTTAAQGTVASETLEGLIEVDADVVSGDSGGALLDDDGEVVGVTTAASSGSSDITGYAIDIDEALDVAQDIIDGVQTDTNTIGYPAFLGVSVASAATSDSSATVPGAGFSAPEGTQESSSSDGGVTVSGVYEDTPAAEAGLEAGDTITAVDGTAITDGEQLTEVLAEHSPGDQVTLTWTDGSGASQSATVTLAEGPAD